MKTVGNKISKNIKQSRRDGQVERRWSGYTGREEGRWHTAKSLGAGVRLPGSNLISATYQLLNSDQSADLNFPICKMEGTKVPNSVCYKD